MKKKGTSMVTVESAGAGDIISMAGLAAPAIGHTVANSEVALCLDRLLDLVSCHKFTNTPAQTWRPFALSSIE